MYIKMFENWSEELYNKSKILKILDEWINASNKKLYFDIVPNIKISSDKSLFLMDEDFYYYKPLIINLRNSLYFSINGDDYDVNFKLTKQNIVPFLNLIYLFQNLEMALGKKQYLDLLKEYDLVYNVNKDGISLYLNGNYMEIELPFERGEQKVMYYISLNDKMEIEVELRGGEPIIFEFEPNIKKFLGSIFKLLK